MGALAVGLGVPLAVSDARASQLQMFTNRLTDTISFASLAGRPIAEGDLAGLQPELARYDIGVRRRACWCWTGTSSCSPPPGRRRRCSTRDGWERVEKALVNRRSEVYPLLMPWDERPIVLAEPVLVDDRILGAVVTVSPDRRAARRGAADLVAGGGGRRCSRWRSACSPRCRSCAGSCARCAGSTRAPTGWRPRCWPAAAPEPVADGTGPPELRRLSESFDRMAETVTQAYAAQRAFVADASHQLRNPLTALRLRLSNLEGHVRPGRRWRSRPRRWRRRSG